MIETMTRYLLTRSLKARRVAREILNKNLPTEHTLDKMTEERIRQSLEALTQAEAKARQTVNQRT